MGPQYGEDEMEEEEGKKEEEDSPKMAPVGSGGTGAAAVGVGGDRCFTVTGAGRRRPSAKTLTPSY